MLSGMFKANKPTVGTELALPLMDENKSGSRRQGTAIVASFTLTATIFSENANFLHALLCYHEVDERL